MNPFKNTLAKVRVLLKEDDALTKDQCAQFQWQLLAKVPDCNFAFTIGKGGINTIFYMAATNDRVVCYPDEALEVLQELCKRNVFCYTVYAKDKSQIGHALFEDAAKNLEGARYIKSISFSGKATLVWKKEKNLFGKNVWVQKAQSVK